MVLYKIEWVVLVVRWVKYDQGLAYVEIQYSIAAQYNSQYSQTGVLLADTMNKANQMVN